MVVGNNEQLGCTTVNDLKNDQNKIQKQYTQSSTTQFQTQQNNCQENDHLKLTNDKLYHKDSLAHTAQFATQSSLNNTQPTNSQGNKQQDSAQEHFLKQSINKQQYPQISKILDKPSRNIEQNCFQAQQIDNVQNFNSQIYKKKQTNLIETITFCDEIGNVSNLITSQAEKQMDDQQDQQIKSAKVLRLQSSSKMFKRHSEEDDDEPSLQSPAPYIMKQISHKDLQRQQSPDQLLTQPPDHSDSQSTHMSPSAPLPEALSIKKSEQIGIGPLIQSPLIVQKSKDDIQNSELSMNITESPSIIKKQSTLNLNQQSQEHLTKNIKQLSSEQNELLNEEKQTNFQIIEQQNQPYKALQRKKTIPAIYHKSECKQDGLTKRMLDINVQDYNNTAKFTNGILGFDRLAEDDNLKNIYSDCKTERFMHNSVMQLRSKSHQGKSPYATSIQNTPAELQAHIDKLRMRSSFQQLPLGSNNQISTFQKFGNQQIQPHYDSIYQLHLQQNQQLSGIDGQSSYSIALRSGNPLAQSITQLHQPLNLTQQHMVLAQSKQSQIDADSQGALIINGGFVNNTNQHQNHTNGHQYEVLLQERSELLQKVDTLQATVDCQRKQLNDQKSIEANLKMQKADLSDDLDDTKQTLAAKETMIQDLKDTLSRQNQQIEQLRDQLSKQYQTSHAEKQALDKKNTELKEINQKIKDDYNRLLQINDNQSSDKKIDQKTSGLIQQKIKEIYELTVELGSLREENNELKKNIEMQKLDFEDRIKEQRIRHDAEYNKVVDELQLLRLEFQEIKQSSDEKISELTNQIKQIQEQQHQTTHEQFQHKQTADQSFPQVNQLDLSRNTNDQIEMLTQQNKLLNQQIQMLTNNVQLKNQPETNCNQSDLFDCKSQAKNGENTSTDKQPSHQKQIQLSTKTPPGNTNQQLTKQTKQQSLKFQSPNLDKQLDQSPEIIGQKTGKLNDHTRKNMIMSQEIQDEIEQQNQQNNEDDVFTPMNISRTDDMGMETRRNPIDTEFSRQQQDDCRRSMGFQSSMQDINDNTNHNQMFNYTERPLNDPASYDSIQFNVLNSNQQLSGILQKCRPQNQLNSRESQNSSDQKFYKTNFLNGQMFNNNYNQFQTTQQPTNKKANLENQGNDLSELENKLQRSPIPSQTIFHQFKKNQTRGNGAGSSSRLSYTRPSMQTSRLNNSSLHQGNSQVVESSDIGSRLITQRRKQKHVMQTSSSYANLQVNDVNAQGSSTSRGVFISKQSSIHNPVSVIRSSGVASQNKICQQQTSNINQNSQQQLSQPNQVSGSNQQLNSQKTQQPCKTRPSMMSGPHQTKAGLTLSQPQLNDSSSVFKNVVHSQKNDTTPNKSNKNQHSVNRKCCKTARQFLQRSPVPQSRQLNGIQTSRAQMTGNSQTHSKSQLNNKHKTQKSQIKTSQQLEKKETTKGQITMNITKSTSNLLLDRRISRSQRMAEHKKKYPSRLELAAQTERINEEPNAINNCNKFSQNNSDELKQNSALNDASNRLVNIAQSTTYLQEQRKHGDETENSQVIIDEHSLQDDQINQKENLHFKTHSNLLKNQQTISNAYLDEQIENINEIETSGHYIDSSNCGDTLNEDEQQPQSQFYKDQERYNLQDIEQCGPVTSREQTKNKISTQNSPRESSIAVSARVCNKKQTIQSNMDSTSINKSNMDEMRQKLQSIQTGKAYLEKKIQEYESRLNQMKVKKDRHSRKINHI